VNGCARSLLLLAAASSVGAILSPTRGSAGTVLSDAAAAMNPGDWVQLATNGIGTALLDTVSGGVGHILPYADKMHWDPVTSRVYFMDSDDPGDGRRFVAYDEASNAWVVLPDPWTDTGVAHQYGLADIDVAGRRIYNIMPDGDRGTYYDFATQSFISFSVPAAAYSCCGAVAYFPERGSLVYAHGPDLLERVTSSGQWRTLSSSINTTYHAIAHYDPVHKLVIFGGGNDSNRTFYKLDQNGQVTTLKQPPINLESPRVEFVVNPATGAFFVFGLGQHFYSYDAMADTWTTLDAPSVPSNLWTGSGGNLLTTVGTAIARYGVAFFTSCENGGTCSVHLYKYAPPPPIPSSPAQLTAN